MARPFVSRIVESREFRRAAPALLSPQQRKHLARLLLLDPEIGSLDPDIKDEMLYHLNFQGVWITYLIRSEEHELLLESIDGDTDPSGSGPKWAKKFVGQVMSQGAARALVEVVKHFLGLEHGATRAKGGEPSDLPSSIGGSRPGIVPQTGVSATYSTDMSANLEIDRFPKKVDLFSPWRNYVLTEVSGTTQAGQDAVRMKGRHLPISISHMKLYVELPVWLQLVN